MTVELEPRVVCVWQPLLDTTFLTDCGINLQINKKVEEICSQFEASWSIENRPNIADLLNSVPRDILPELLSALVILDIRLVKQSGATPNQSDYKTLGEDAVSIAQGQLGISYPGFQKPNDQLDETRFLDSQESILNDASSTGGLLEVRNERVLKPFTMFAGKYKLLKRIAEGGMGDVWMAEQQEPLVRNVAVKFIRPEIDSKDALARFEAERQAIAMMDHPNIAKIYDAGTAEDGSPYFVMELVNGIPLNL